MFAFDTAAAADSAADEEEAGDGDLEQDAVEMLAKARAFKDWSNSVSISRDCATFATARRMRASCVKQLGLNSAR